MEIDGLDELKEGLQKVVQKGVDELNRGLDRINNPDKKPMSTDTCPNCTAKLNFSSSDRYITCEYCGTQVENNRSVVDTVFDFVEKQQKAASANNAANNSTSAAKARLDEIKAEHEALKLERKIAMKERRRKARIVRKIIFLCFIIACGYYYVNNKAVVDANILPIISNFLENL